MMHRVADMHALYVLTREQQCRQAQQMPCASMLPICYSHPDCMHAANVPS